MNAVRRGRTSRERGPFGNAGAPLASFEMKLRRSRNELVLGPEERTMTKLMKRLWTEEDGATMVEYGLMLALIAVICIGAVALIGTNASTMFTNIAGSL